MSISHAANLALVCCVLVTLGCGNTTDELVAQLGDPDPEIRCTAARGLGEQRENVRIVVPALSRASQDADVEVREVAISALGQIGSAANASLPDLDEALDDSERAVRLAAALAIQKIDPQRRSYAPVILESLRAGHGPVFLEVGRMGADAEWAVPTLVKLLSHRHTAIRALAAQTLGEIGVAANDAESSLQRSLRDPEPAVRRAARRALEQIQSQPAAAR